MPRETVQEKAGRLLGEGRLTIERMDHESGLIVATCKGDSGAYHLGYDPARRQFRCTCPEMKGKCSHLAALKLVITVAT